MDKILKKLKLAVLYKKIRLSEDLAIFFPLKFIFGETTKKDMYMLDYTNAVVYENSKLSTLEDEDKVYSINDVISIYELLKKHNTTKLKEALAIEIENITNNIYYLETTDKMPIVKALPKEEFIEKYGIYISDSFTEALVTILTNDSIDENSALINDGNVTYNATEEEIEEPEINIKEIYEEIKNSVYAQDEAIKTILTAIYKNKLIDDPRMKTNLLLYGSSGVGKTEILRQIQRITSLPVVIEDMNSYTISGYKGNNVEDLLRKLYIASNYNIELAQQGILCLDEIDKKVSNGDENSISFEGVLNSLLKIIEGGKFEFSINDIEKIEFDTSNLTIIASGAFSQLSSKLSKNKKSIGFNNIYENKEESATYTTEDFIEYGLPREFIGRFSSIVKLNDLSREDLKSILLTSKISALNVNIEMFKKLNFDISISDELIDKIIEKAYKEKIGARALNRIINNLFEQATFDALLNASDEEQVLEFDDKSIDDNKKYKILKKEL